VQHAPKTGARQKHEDEYPDEHAKGDGGGKRGTGGGAADIAAAINKAPVKNYICLAGPFF